MSEPFGHLIRRALTKSEDVAAASLGAGGIYMLDGAYDFLPFAEPLQAAGPGAVAAVGLFQLISRSASLVRRRVRLRRVNRLVNELEDAGRRGLSRRLKRILTAYRLGQLTPSECESLVDQIVEDYLRRQG